jgi:hypothetical protein
MTKFKPSVEGLVHPEANQNTPFKNAPTVKPNNKILQTKLLPFLSKRYSADPKTDTPAKTSPHKETLATMKKLQIPTYDTCNNGTIVFESDGKIFVLKNKNIKEVEVGCGI